MANEPYGSIIHNGVNYSSPGGGGGISPSELLQVSDNIAPKQETSTASKLITTGEYFINADGDLCQCDVQIASGGSIIVGSNCHVISDGIGNDLNNKSAWQSTTLTFYQENNQSWDSFTVNCKYNKKWLYIIIPTTQCASVSWYQAVIPSSVGTLLFDTVRYNSPLQEYPSDLGSSAWTANIYIPANYLITIYRNQNNGYIAGTILLPLN